MFDADGNEMVDKREFLVVRPSALHNTVYKMHLITHITFCIILQLEEIFRKKKDRKEVAEDAQRVDLQV